MSKKHFGTYIKEKRENSNISLEKLAKLLGISKTLLQKIESGERKFVETKLLMLANILNIDPKELISEYFKLQYKKKIKITDSDIYYMMKNGFWKLKAKYRIERKEYKKKEKVQKRSKQITDKDIEMMTRKLKKIVENEIKDIKVSINQLKDSIFSKGVNIKVPKVTMFKMKFKDRILKIVRILKGKED